MMHSDTLNYQQAGRKFIKRAIKAPLLEREWEWDLARSWRDHGDEAALHELVNAYVRLVVETVAHYSLPMGISYRKAPSV